jgi:hypothetical protein
MSPRNRRHQPHPERIVAEPLTSGSLEIGVPTLGQVHGLGPPPQVYDLGAAGIVTARPDIAPEFRKPVDALPAKKKPKRQRDVTLYRILEVLPVESMSTAEILQEVEKRWPAGSKPLSRDTVARRLSRRK